MNLTAEQLQLLPMWYVAFLLSLTCHEGAHALAAKLGGDMTAFNAGQATLNPVPHVRREPFGTVIFPLLTYVLSHWMMGWASAPYDPRWQERYPRRAAVMAMAGPVANFTLAIIAAVAMRVGLGVGAFISGRVNFTGLVAAPQGGVAEGLGTFLSILFALNILLGTFNLIPVPPLDGASVITLIMPERVALRFLEFASNRMFSLLGLIVAWQLFGPIFEPIFGAAVGLLYFGYQGA
ncbi:MAG TPA: site-2 protease family protein [Bryobacteraceae bacterium]|nr:site-2 protease family protein [Bryobacteraceae bacterium]